MLSLVYLKCHFFFYFTEYWNTINSLPALPNTVVVEYWDTTTSLSALPNTVVADSEAEAVASQLWTKFIPEGVTLFQVYGTIEVSDNYSGHFPCEYKYFILAPSLEVADLVMRRRTSIRDEINSIIPSIRDEINSIIPINTINTYSAKEELAAEVAKLQLQYGLTPKIIYEEVKESELVLWLITKRSRIVASNSSQELLMATENDIKVYKEKNQGAQVERFVPSLITTVTVRDLDSLLSEEQVKFKKNQEELVKIVEKIQFLRHMIISK